MAIQCDINATSWHGKTALHHALNGDIGTDNEVTGADDNVIRFLVVTLKANPTIPNKYGQTASDLAKARKRSRELIELLEKNSPPSSTRS